MKQQYESTCSDAAEYDLDILKWAQEWLSLWLSKVLMEFISGIYSNNFD